MQYRFTLNYQIANAAADIDALIERLGAAGCDDALVGVGLSGRIALEFTRTADSAHAAMTSALADVKRAIPSAQLIEATPDFVGLSDAADVVGVSRQNLRKIMLAHQRDFPLPVHSGSSSVWHLEDLATWLQKTMNYKVPAETIEIACVAKQVNLARQAVNLKPQTQRELRQLVI
jgi:predicted DNA-binding transcriptional regulator AlpA